MTARTRLHRHHLRAAVAVGVVALAFGACTPTEEPAATPSTPEPAQAPSPEPEAEAEATAPAPADTPSETPSEVSGTAPQDVVTAGASGAEYASCHERSDAGGASDGVLSFPIDEEELATLQGATVEVDVEKGDGSIVTVAGTLDSDGIVFLIPLSNFGEVITIIEVRVDGEPVDVGLEGTMYTVEPESECSNHPKES